MPPNLPPGSSAVTMPSSNPGFQSEAMADIRNATKILEKALPKLGMETDEGKRLHSIIGSLAKIAPSSDGNTSIDAASLRNIRSQAQQASPMQALMRMLGGQQGGPQQPAGAQMAPPGEA